MKRESSSKWQWFVPIVRLQPYSSLHLRLRSKLIWIAETLFGILLAKAGIRGARVIEISSSGNFILKFNADNPIGRKGETVMIAKDLVIFESVRSKGIWEPHIVSFLAEPLVGKKLRELEGEYTFLDIGANSGLITRQLANVAEKDFSAICVEPLKQNFEALSFNISSRTRLSSFKIFPYALGDINCELEIYTEKANIGNSSLLEMQSRNVDKNRIVQKSTSEFIEENFKDRNKVILKCDTQGYETKILSQFPESFWQKVEYGAIEVRSLPMISHLQVDMILNFLANFSNIFWIDSHTRHPVEIAELKKFWLSETNEELDLCFSR